MAADSAAPAVASDAPGPSRPTTWREFVSRSGMAFDGRNGSHRSTSARGNPKCAGITPTISCGASPMPSVLPTTPGSAPNRDRQNASDSTTTAPEPSSPSRSVRVRPSTAGFPRRRKAFGVMRTTRSASGRSSSRTVAVPGPLSAARSASPVFSACRRSSKFG